MDIFSLSTFVLIKKVYNSKFGSGEENNTCINFKWVTKLAGMANPT